jgi:hypothetical protein
MDHADIRGLATAFNLSVAGLPQSSVGGHRLMPTYPARGFPSPGLPVAFRLCMSDVWCVVGFGVALLRPVFCDDAGAGI